MYIPMGMSSIKIKKKRFDCVWPEYTVLVTFTVQAFHAVQKEKYAYIFCMSYNWQNLT
jgi:hypothetical protein